MGLGALRERLKNYGLALCLFVFLFVVIGGGLHLNLAAAFICAVTGTPLVIYVFHGLRPASPHYNVHFDSEKCQSSPVGAQAPSLTSEHAIRLEDAGVADTPTTSAQKPEPSRVRRRLPDERCALTHHFSIAGQEGYVTVGVYEDGLPGEIFITMAKQGSTISGLMDCFAIAVSLALQYGVPLQVLCGKFTYTRFEPSGWSGNPKIGYAKSIVDYIFRWLELKFLTGKQGELFKALPLAVHASAPSDGSDPVEALGELLEMGDAPACNVCGSLMMRSGTCHR